MKSGLLISFSDQSESFTLGVEYGRILGRIQSGLPLVSNDGMPVHLANRDVITDTCLLYGYIPIFGQTYYGEWIDFVASKKVTGEN